MVNPGYLYRIVIGCVICLFLFLAQSCSKEPFKVAVVTMHYSGDFVKGGCGWILVVDSLNAYEAANLQDSYKMEGMKLNITYKVLDMKPDCTNSLIVKDVIYLHKVDGM